MARNIPSGIFNEGAVVFDSQPYVNMYNQYQLRKQAKDEALDKYFQDFGKNITPAGMRNQDIPILTAKTNEWRDFYSQNKKEISNPRLDGGKAYSEYMSRYQDQLQTIEQSKNAAGRRKQMSQVMADPKKRDLVSEETIQSMDHDNLPLNHPQYKPFDVAEFDYRPEPFDAKMREGVYRAMTSGLTPSKVAGMPQQLPNFQIKTPYTQQFSPDDVKAIGNRAMAFADSDKSIKYYADKELLPSVLKDPEKFNELNNVYKRYYGKDAETGQELFAAQSILDLNRKSVEEKIEPDVYGRDVAMQRIRHADAKDLIDYKKKIDPNDSEMNNLWVQQYLGQLKEDAQKTKPIEYKYKNGTRVSEYDIPVDPVLGKALAEGSVTPDAVRVDSDGNYRRIFYQRYGKGEEGGKEGELKQANGKIAVDETISGKKITEDQVALALGYRGQTKKQLEGTMKSVLKDKTQQKAKHPLPSGKPRTVTQGGYTYTYNDETGEYD